MGPNEKRGEWGNVKNRDNGHLVAWPRVVRCRQVRLPEQDRESGQVERGSVTVELLDVTRRKLVLETESRLASCSKGWSGYSLYS